MMDMYLYYSCSCPDDLQLRGQCQAPVEVPFSTHSWGWEVHPVQSDKVHQVQEVQVRLGLLFCPFSPFCQVHPAHELENVLITYL